jgi:hypothetical protein
MARASYTVQGMHIVVEGMPLVSEVAAHVAAAGKLGDSSCWEHHSLGPSRPLVTRVPLVVAAVVAVSDKVLFGLDPTARWLVPDQ